MVGRVAIFSFLVDVRQRRIPVAYAKLVVFRLVGLSVPLTGAALQF